MTWHLFSVVSTISQDQMQIIELKNSFCLLIALWAEKRTLSDALFSEKSKVQNNVYCTLLSFVYLRGIYIYQCLYLHGVF